MTALARSAAADCAGSRLSVPIGPRFPGVRARDGSRARAPWPRGVTVVCYGHGGRRIRLRLSSRPDPQLPGYNNLRAGPDWVKPVLDIALAAKIASLPADIVHAHNYEAPIAAFLAQRFTGTPIVYSAHNTMREELPTYFEATLGAALRRSSGTLLDRTVPQNGRACCCARRREPRSPCGYFGVP